MQVRDVSLMWRAIIALTIAYSSFIAEIFRAGIQAVDAGQIEAAKALGLSRYRRFRHIIWPQAIRTILPPFGNDFIAMVKDCSLVSVLGVADITQMGKIYASGSFRFFETYSIVAYIYLILTVGLSLSLRSLEQRAAKQEGRTAMTGRPGSRRRSNRSMRRERRTNLAQPMRLGRAPTTARPLALGYCLPFMITSWVARYVRRTQGRCSMPAAARACPAPICGRSAMTISTGSIFPKRCWPSPPPRRLSRTAAGDARQDIAVAGQTFRARSSRPASSPKAMLRPRASMNWSA